MLNPYCRIIGTEDRRTYVLDGSVMLAIVDIESSLNAMNVDMHVDIKHGLPINIRFEVRVKQQLVRGLMNMLWSHDKIDSHSKRACWAFTVDSEAKIATTQQFQTVRPRGPPVALFLSSKPNTQSHHPPPAPCSS